ncbi:glycosyltransferase [Candidatus Njordibacter sp. Uisw_039]|uniref:glycosyltransferase n=1 Tax=Candidatus Njordibacter sp. Uisw_039 TaxID=3230972 RepID=UPI003D4B175D
MKLFIFAPNVRSGGGLVLLKELFLRQPSKLVSKWFLAETCGLELQSNISLFEAGFFGRLRAELSLYIESSQETIILAFHGSPTLLPVRGRQILYLQNLLLVSNISLAQYSYKTRLRLNIERCLLKKRWGAIHLFFVQTESMNSALINFADRYSLPKPRVIVLPFISSHFHGPRRKNKDWLQGEKQIFFYPSFFHPHKNHLNLLKAWSVFVKSDSSEFLYLTITQSQLDYIISSNNSSDWNVRVVALGEITHNEVLTILQNSKALVFPSAAESFGLPLLEAKQLNVPILASERDFVRDVCSPIETFDPESSLSILRALRRFSGHHDSFQDVEGGAGVWNKLVDLIDSELDDCR